MRKTFSVELVSITKPCIKGIRTPEQLVTYTARVSNPNNQLNLGTAPKLIKYLLDNGHYSPFEQVDLGIVIETSRGISPQILRHWSFSFQEFSQRYSEVQEYITYPARRQDLKNRQNSVDDLDSEARLWFKKAQQEIWSTSFDAYTKALKMGIAKEQARFLLPLNTKTKLYMKGNLRDWIFYLKLRSGNGTQQEHADIAQAVISTIFIKYFPVTSGVLGWK